jgi:hypothetical protein
VKAVPWIVYAIATCLLVLAIVQCEELIRADKDRLRLQVELQRADKQIGSLEQSNALVSLHLVGLAAQSPDYAAARIFVAWDGNQHRGSIALENMPLTPEGHDYQLWVLDPNALAPLNAGVIAGARTFAVPDVSVPLPGFGISLEPKGGSANPTPPFLFAVAPPH